MYNVQDFVSCCKSRPNHMLMIVDNPVSVQHYCSLAVAAYTCISYVFSRQHDEDNVCQQPQFNSAVKISFVINLYTSYIHIYTYTIYLIHIGRFQQSVGTVLVTFSKLSCVVWRGWRTRFHTFNNTGKHMM